jgi:2-(1,2-epoxy-1,2-dihydrophenyl)acetyl-CoA isomerase
VSEPLVLFEPIDGVARITLNRPDKRNALTERMLADLLAAFQRIGQDRALRAVLLTGTGSAFCAGQDLAEPSVSAPGADPGDLLDRLYNPLIRAIHSLDRPVVCAVNGVAAGAGANLALACDLVLAGRSASFIQAFCRLGLIPDAGGTHALPHLVGQARALGLALLGEPLGAEQAERWGLIWRAVDDERLAEEAGALACHLARQATVGLGLAKRAIRAATGRSLDQQLDLERDLQRAAARTADVAEGIAAFLAKRPPVFQGR